MLIVHQPVALHALPTFAGIIKGTHESARFSSKNIDWGLECQNLLQLIVSLLISFVGL